MFQDSTQFYPKPHTMKSSHSYFFFFFFFFFCFFFPLSVFLTRRYTNVPTSWPVTNTPWVWYQTDWRDQPQLQAFWINLSATGKQQMTTVLAMDVVSMFFQICLFKSRLLISLPHEIRCVHYLLIWLFSTADTRTQLEFCEIPQRAPKAGGNHRLVKGWESNQGEAPVVTLQPVDWSPCRYHIIYHLLPM